MSPAALKVVRRQLEAAPGPGRCVRQAALAAEFGSAPGARNQWFTDAARFVRTDPLARRRPVGVVYFHAHMDNCDWDVMNQDDDGRRGWMQAFRSINGFTGTPFSLAPR